MGSCDEEFPAIPSMLVQTFPLDAYLRALSNKLSERMNTLQSTLVTLQQDVKLNNVSINNMRRFLREQSLIAVHEKMHEGSIEPLDGSLLESLLPEFLREDVITASLHGENSSTVSSSCAGEWSKKGSLNTLSTLIEKINKDNSQRIHREEEKARQKTEDVIMQFEKMREEMERLQERYKGDLERIMAWFRPMFSIEGADDDGDGNKNNNNENNKNGNSAIAGVGLRDVLQTSILFIEFRRLLLRDMADRICEANDQQSMILGNTVVALKEEMRREMMRNKDSGHTGGSSGDCRSGTVDAADTDRRLKGLDRNYMQRNEITALLKEKAGVFAVAQKAEEVYVRDLERRLLERLDDIEERMSLYEAERKDFRRILRAVVDFHQRGRNVITCDANKKDDDGVTQPLAGALANFLAVDDAADPRRVLENKRFLTDDEQSKTGRTKMLHSKQRANTEEFVSATAGHKKEDRFQMLQQQRLCGVEAEVNKTSRREVVGLTVNQEAYANYVTPELNRREIETLPPLPYERARYQ